MHASYERRCKLKFERNGDVNQIFCKSRDYNIQVDSKVASTIVS